jgi:hypothetical protein
MSREGLLPDLREALEEVRSSHAAAATEPFTKSRSK